MIDVTLLHQPPKGVGLPDAHRFLTFRVASSEEAERMMFDLCHRNAIATFEPDHSIWTVSQSWLDTLIEDVPENTLVQIMRRLAS